MEDNVIDKDKVSVIVPIYNAERYLKECIDSIISQTYKNLEVILINDGSEDNSGKIADQYAKKDDRIKVFHQKNAGVSAARNFGIRIASGKYLSFIDSDDYIRKDFVNSLVSDLVSYDADIVTTATKLNPIDDRRVDSSEVLDASEAIIRIYYGRLERSDNGVQMIAKKLLKDNGIVFDHNKRVSEDFDFIVKAINATDKVVVDYRGMYYYRPNEDSVMHRKLNSDFFEAMSNKTTLGLSLVSKYPGLLSAVRVDAFSSSVSLALRGYHERHKWRREFAQVWYNLSEYKWPVLINNSVGLKTRAAALIYCVFGNNLATIMLRTIKKWT